MNADQYTPAYALLSRRPHGARRPAPAPTLRAPAAGRASHPTWRAAAASGEVSQSAKKPKRGRAKAADPDGKDAKSGASSGASISGTYFAEDWEEEDDDDDEEYGGGSRRRMPPRRRSPSWGARRGGAAHPPGWQPGGKPGRQPKAGQEAIRVKRSCARHCVVSCAG